jgi:hypothetical protein
MELYFSCLVRMKLRFHEHAASDDHVIAAENLAVRFRPVMTKTCHISDFEDEPPVTDFPIKNPAAFVPHWLRIDFRHGSWSGEFGYRWNEAKYRALHRFSPQKSLALPGSG